MDNILDYFVVGQVLAFKGEDNWGKRKQTKLNITILYMTPPIYIAITFAGSAFSTCLHDRQKCYPTLHQSTKTGILSKTKPYDRHRIIKQDVEEEEGRSAVHIRSHTTPYPQIFAQKSELVLGDVMADA
ncbi:hypothetical protein ACJX0J_029711 [Zea mays]